MLEKVKKALRLTTDAYDDEVEALIAAAFADLALSGIQTDNEDPLVFMAVVTYCRVRFGTPSDYDRVKASYDEQKAQLISATGYGLGEAE